MSSGENNQLSSTRERSGTEEEDGSQSSGGNDGSDGGASDYLTDEDEENEAAVSQDDISEDIETQAAELSEHVSSALSDYFERNRFDGDSMREHMGAAFALYTQIMHEYRGMSQDSTSHATADRVAFYRVYLSTMRMHLGTSAQSKIHRKLRDKAIDKLLIPVHIDQMKTESEPCPICDEPYDGSIEDGKSHGACMVPKCKHVFGRVCINTWLKEEQKSTCPMCRAKIDLPSGPSSERFVYGSYTFNELVRLMVLDEL